MSLHQDLNSLQSREADKLSIARKINGVPFDGANDITVGGGGGGGSGDATSIAGVPVSISSLAAGDLLQYTGSNWSNSNQFNITDGGNF